MGVTSQAVASNRGVARRDAVRLLDRTPVAAGAQKVTHPPRALWKPSVQAASRQVRRSRFWRAPHLRDPSRFLRIHRPPGVESAFPHEAGHLHTIVYRWPAVTGRLTRRWLIVSIHQRPGGHAFVRADAEVVPIK